jgi:AraC family transcriptional activator of pyochelin receptor
MPDNRNAAIKVSDEMTVVVGQPQAVIIPERAVALAYTLGTIQDSATIAIVDSATVPALMDNHGPGTRIVLLVDAAVITRMERAMPITGAVEMLHMPSELRTIALALRDCDVPREAGDLYRSAKAVELLCETLRLRAAALLQPLAAHGALSRAHSLRIMAARRLIDERWSEKLSLEKIATSCGLNRESLTRGFREMFKCSIAEALAERRLGEASRMLLTTDLPVSSIGYENGYGNNASFARAFGRRFGLSPSDYRAQRLAA